MRPNTARLWNAETGHELLTHSGNEDAVTQSVFGPDGKRLFTFGRDSASRKYLIDLGELKSLTGERETR